MNGTPAISMISRSKLVLATHNTRNRRRAIKLIPVKDIPPIGMRRVRLRVSSVLQIFAAIFVGVLGICFSILFWMTAIGRWWTGSLLIVGLVTLPTAYFYRELARQRRLLETGTALEAQIVIPHW